MTVLFCVPTDILNFIIQMYYNTNKILTGIDSLQSDAKRYILDNYKYEIKFWFQESLYHVQMLACSCKKFHLVCYKHVQNILAQKQNLLSCLKKKEDAWSKIFYLHLQNV